MNCLKIKFIQLLIIVFCFLITRPATAASPTDIYSFTVGSSAILIIHHQPVICLKSGYLGLNAAQRMKLVEKRIRDISSDPESLQEISSVSREGLVGLIYRGQWLVLVDPETAYYFHKTRLELAELWSRNLVETLQSAGRDGEVIKTFEGVTSWYGKELAGRRTASGEMFDALRFTAAHRTLPFGTKIRVTNLKNNRSVQVTINDRGPWIKGRELDISWAAARAIGISGVGLVKIEVLATPKNGE